MKGVPGIFEANGELVANNAFLDWLQDGLEAGDLVVLGHTRVPPGEDPETVCERMGYTGNKPGGRDHVAP